MSNVPVPVLRVADTIRRIVWRIAGPRTIGVRAIVVDDERRVLLVRHTYGKPAWHLPGGGVKRRETLDRAVRRELDEEVGIEVTGPMRVLGAYTNLQEGKSDHIVVFVVEAWRRRGENGYDNDNEIAASGTFAVDEVPETTSPGTRRRLAEWEKGHVTAYEW